MEPAHAEDTTVMGDYVVLKRVAIGGMAEIFLARRDGMSGFERLVVLKRILPEYAHNNEFVQMFLNEARIAATLHHTNIVQVHGIGEERGQVFFAMEFLHGEDLSRVLSRANQIGKAPQLEAVLTIATAVCAGLHYAHERCGPDGRSLGIVHRDVSPHNVFVTYDGNIKLLDFGIAKASTSFGKTRTGVLKGKVAYMSPEQAYAQPVDRRSDIFCMGILLWELSTGRRLYRRRSELETLKALVDADAPRPSTVVSGYPAELEAIVMKCLARDPAARYATCEELSEAIETFARSSSLQVSPLIATRMMRSLFKAEIATFEAAVKSGSNLVDQVVARMEATAKNASIDDWDSNVASVIVDIGSDADKTALSGPIEQTSVEQPAIPEDEVTEANPPVIPDSPFLAPEIPTTVPNRGHSAVALSAAPATLPKREDLTLQLSAAPAVRAKRPLWLIAAGALVVAVAVAIAIVKSGDAPDAAAAAKPHEPEPVLAEPKAEPIEQPVATRPPEPDPPKPAVVEPKPPEAKKPKLIVAKPRAEIRRPIAAKKPVAKPEPKKPEPKKPTAKDLDALPL